MDGLRFVAIAAVVLFHLSDSVRQIHPAGGWLPALLGSGYYGVHLFFVLSGFLLAIPFARWRLGLGARPLLRNYYLRRVTRLEPPYVAAALMLFVAGFFTLGPRAGLARWPYLLATLIYQHSLIFGEPSRIGMAFWTLEVEVQFYLLAPFFASVFSIRSKALRRAVLLAAIVLPPLLRYFLNFRAGGRGRALPWFLEFFAAGFFLADLYLTDWKENPERSFAWDFGSLAAWAAMVALVSGTKHPFALPLLILAAYVCAFRGRVSSRLFSRPLLTGIGAMCYSLYLFHSDVIALALRAQPAFLNGASFTAQLAFYAVLSLPAILLFCGFFFVALERPCMDPAWPSKLRRLLLLPRFRSG